LWSNGIRDDLKVLKEAITSALVLGGEIDCESISIPHMTHPNFPYPPLPCCKVLFGAIEDFAKSIDINDPEIDMPLRVVKIILDSEDLVLIYEREFLRRYSTCSIQFGNGGILDVLEETEQKKKIKVAFADKRKRDAEIKRKRLAKKF
jgi:hypothetical protein